MTDLKKTVHHIRYNRPQWYKDYHEWEHHAALHWITFAVSCLIILAGFMNVVNQTQKLEVRKASADTKSTVVTQDVTGGSLTITSTANQSMSAVGVDTVSHNTTGTLGDVTVTDSRGTGVGWTASATSTNFYKYNDPVKVSGSNSTVSLGTTTPYATSSAGIYTITIATGGSVGTATFNVTGLESATGVTTGTGSNIAVGTNGLTVNFGAATYSTGDSWTVRVDTIPVTGFQVAPGTRSIISGDGTNVNAGSTNLFTAATTNSNPLTLMTASTGYGMGSYKVTPDLQLTVPANTYANTYTATVTETAT